MTSSCSRTDGKIVAAAIFILTMAVVPLGTSGQTGPTRAQIKKPLIYEIGNLVHINATGPRPLVVALDALQAKYGWGVDYEDPRYLTDPNTRPSWPAGPPRRHPNVNFTPEALSVDFHVDPAQGGLPDENYVLTTIVNAYNQQNANQFELRKQAGNRFAVVGVSVENEQGESQSQQPVLDTEITLPSENAAAQQTIALICEKVSRQSGISVIPGGLDELPHGAVKVGGTTTARAVLTRTLRSSGAHLNWRLLYDAAAKSYELNIVSPSQ